MEEGGASPPASPTASSGWPHTLTRASPATLAASGPDSPPPRATLGPENTELPVAPRTASGALRPPPRPKPSRANRLAPDIPHRSAKVRCWEVSVVSASPWQRPAPGSERCVKQVLSATFSGKRSPPPVRKPARRVAETTFPTKERAPAPRDAVVRAAAWIISSGACRKMVSG